MSEKEIAVYEEKALTMLEWAKKIKVDSEISQKEAVEFNSNVKAYVKGVEAFFEPLKKEARLPWQKLCDRENAAKANAKEASEIVGGKISDYIMKQDRLYEIEKKKAEEEARRAEEKRKEELRRQAQNHLAKGREDKAQERIEMAEDVFIPQRIVEKPETSINVGGKIIAMQEHLDVIIEDEEKAIAANIFPAHCMKLKLAEIKAYIKANRITKVPGLRIQKRYIQKG